MSTYGLGTADRIPGVADAFTTLRQLAEGNPLGTLLKTRENKSTAIEQLTSVFETEWWQRLWVRDFEAQSCCKDALTFVLRCR